jgi:hypothetical protein
VKFSLLREIRDTGTLALSDIITFLTRDFGKTIRELDLGLTRLSFVDNFRAFKTTVTIPAGTELAIRNELRSVIPSERIILRSNSSSIVDGDTAWSLNFVYLKNTGGSQATITVVFLE